MPDRWSRWVLGTRHGDDAVEAARVAVRLTELRDGVLEHAAVAPGDVVLDIGTGDGLIGLAAARLVAPTGRVIFCDVSADLLAHVESAVGDGGDHRFLLARAEDLSDLESGSVDVVVMRAVLIYVQEKARALQEMHRVLRPGGRLSLCEPINRRMCDPDRYWHYDVTPIRPLMDRLGGGAPASDRPDPMTDFDESDLLQMAEAAGFSDLHLRLHVDVEGSVDPMRWDTFVHVSMNPNAPTLADSMRRALDRGRARSGRAPPPPPGGGRHRGQPCRARVPLGDGVGPRHVRAAHPRSAIALRGNGRADTIAQVVTWGELAAAEPELARDGAGLLYQFGVGLGFLATVRRDGGPRVRPMCPLLAGGGLFAFIIPSPKQHDLLRDGRYALHSFPSPENEDAFSVTGVAVAVADAARRGALASQFVEERAAIGVDPPAAGDVLFELHVDGAMLTRTRGHGDPSPVHTVWPSRAPRP